MQIKIDGAALKAWVKEQGLTCLGVGNAIGRSNNYISTCMYTGSINEHAYRLLLNVYDLPDGSFQPVERPREPVATPPPSGGDQLYTLSLSVKPEKVRVGVNFQGKEIYHGWSHIKGQTEEDLMQAISYAAHMCYKFSQQDALGK